MGTAQFDGTPEDKAQNRAFANFVLPFRGALLGRMATGLNLNFELQVYPLWLES
jgi:hypothetical protein